tara:strand:- start:3018 stop:3494 length:477 start_codon:yes stop_codon:yes gene_type:complete
MAQKSNVVSGAWKALPINVRGYILLAGMGFAGYKIYKWYQQEVLDSEINKKAAEIKAYNKAGIVASFPDNQYVTWGKLINDELNSITVDEDKIYGVFRQLKNIVDLYKLQSAVTYTEGFLFKLERTLDEVLAFFLFDSDINVINKILLSKNINYTFPY